MNSYRPYLSATTWTTSARTKSGRLEVKSATGREKIDGYDPRKGFTAILMSTFFTSVSRLGAKHLYNKYSSMGAIEFVFYRALLGFAFCLLWLNCNLKKEIYTSLQRELVPTLILKVTHGNIMCFAVYSAILWWPLTTVASSLLVQPFMVMLLSGIFLKEYSTYQQIGFLVMTLIGAMIMILYTP